MKLLIRADGHKRIGMGHLYEMLQLAEYMAQNYAAEIIFVTRNNLAALELFQSSRVKYYPLPFNISRKKEILEINRISAFEKPDILILDLLRVYHDSQYMHGLKNGNTFKSVVFSNTHSKRPINADIVFSYSLYQKSSYYAEARNTTYYLGYDYILLPVDFIEKSGRHNNRQTVNRVMVCMGGADHNNLTFSILKAIDVSEKEFVIDLVLNTSFFDKTQVASFKEKMKHRVDVHYDIKGIACVLNRADMAITAGGNTLIDRMCAGVPGIVITQLKNQEKSVRKIAESGATIDLGFFKRVTSDELLKTFDHFFDNRNLRISISKKGRKLVDGKGIGRVAEIIHQSLIA